MKPTELSRAEQRLIAGWGWKNPPNTVIQIAKQSISLQSIQSGAALSVVCNIEPQRVQDLLSKKPANIKTIEWVAQQEPMVRPHVNKLLTLRSEYPYYDNLGILTPHPKINDPVIQKRCNEIDAMLMVIENTNPLLVFSSYLSLLKYDSIGRENRVHDPIRMEFGNTLFLSVGKSDNVIAAIEVAKQKETMDSGETDSIWHGSSASEPYQKQIVRLLDFALLNQITDIAITPLRNGSSSIFMRQYGDLISPASIQHLEAKESSDIIHLLLAKSGANPTGARVRDPRDGQITYRSDSGDAFLRLSFIPLNHPGTNIDLLSVSIRLFSRTENEIRLKDLKIREDVIEQLLNVTKLSQGLILAAGPTNTGKSTLLAGIIGEHHNYFGSSRKRISIEDPVERFISGITQINVPEFMDHGFETILRSIKRHDPDLISVGEVRDTETAETCVTSASSGHLVLSTIHANDTLIAYDVLSKMVSKDKRYQLIESLSLIISQRLVKQVCPRCAKIEVPTLEEQGMFQQYVTMNEYHCTLPTRVVHASPQGCPDCTLGYMGILPINEILPISRTVRNAMLDMLEGANRRDVLSKNRSITLFESAFSLVELHQIELHYALI